MQKKSEIKNFFRPYEIGIYGSIAAAVIGAIGYFAYFYWGVMLILPGIIGFIVFDSLRVKAAEYDRILKERIEKLRGVGKFEPQETFWTYARGGAEHFKVGGDGTLRTDRYWRTDLRFERETLRLEAYGIRAFRTGETEILSAELPLKGLSAELEIGSVAHKNRSYKDAWLMLRTADGEEYRFPVASNSADTELVIDKIRRYNNIV